MRLTDLLSPERVGIKRANGEPFDKEKAIGLLAVLLGAGNAAGGYVVTERMLDMFKTSRKPEPKA